MTGPDFLSYAATSLCINNLTATSPNEENVKQSLWHQFVLTLTSGFPVCPQPWLDPLNGRNSLGPLPLPLAIDEVSCERPATARTIASSSGPTAHPEP